MRLAGIVVGMAALLVMNEAMAAACAGPSEFGDVAQTDLFCTDVSWLANRGVTLGCGSGVFCPADNVSRAQMALFMQRLGTVLSPQAATIFETSKTLNPITTLTEPFSETDLWCKTGTLSAAAYPRLVLATGWVSMAAGSGGARG